MFHQHNHATHTRDQVHRAAHTLDHFSGNHPIRQIACLGDLHRTQNGKIDFAGADHAKRVGRGKNR